MPNLARPYTGALVESYRSFAAQALHYFQRDHDAIARDPILSPAAWTGKDMARTDAWIERLSAAEAVEIEDSLDRACKQGIAIRDLTRETFALPTLAPRIAAWARELDRGRGFVLVRGFPVEHLTQEQCEMAYWGLGLHLGVPGGQNPQEDLLGHVTDMGEEAQNPFVRRYRTAGDIAYHCDLADVVGLLCLRTPRSGGASRIVSSVSVYNELLRRRPDLIDRLYEPFLLDSREEQRDGAPAYFPVPPCRFAGKRLRTFYHSDYFRSVVRHQGIELTERERTLMDLYEQIASSPELYLDMFFEPGDIQLISNHVILHSRTAYEDWPEAGRKRHLLRLWLSLQ